MRLVVLSLVVGTVCFFLGIVAAPRDSPQRAPELVRRPQRDGNKGAPNKRNGEEGDSNIGSQRSPKSAESVKWALFGAVRDTAGHPCPHAVVEVSNEDLVRRAVADASGIYILTGLPEGTCDVTCVHPEYYMQRCRLEFRGKGTGVEKTWTLKSSPRVFVRFETPSGEAYRDAAERQGVRSRSARPIVVVTRGALGRSFVPAMHGAWQGLGKFLPRKSNEMPSKWDGVLVVRAMPPPLYASAVIRSQVVDTQALGSDVKELKFVVPFDVISGLRTTVKFRMEDLETSRPIENASVFWRDVLGVEAVTGARRFPGGLVVLKNQLVGMKMLIVHAHGYEKYGRVVRAPFGEELDLGTVRLHKAIQLEGRVVDHQGRGLNTAVLLVRNLTRMREDEPLENHTRFGTRDDGTFVLHRLGSGPHLIIAEAKGLGRRGLILDPKVQAGKAVEIRMGSGIAVSVVSDLAWDRPRMLKVELDGVPVFGDYVGPGKTRELTLSPGTYVFRVVSPGRAEQSRTLVVADHETTVRLRE